MDKELYSALDQLFAFSYIVSVTIISEGNFNDIDVTSDDVNFRIEPEGEVVIYYGNREITIDRCISYTRSSNEVVILTSVGTTYIFSNDSVLE